MAGELLIEVHNRVTILTLSNLPKRNALDPSLCAALSMAVTGLANAGTRAAVLTGEGNQAFCSGFDVAALPEPDDPEQDQAAGHPFDLLIDAMAASPVPVVAALNGVAFGGGCELAATCDVRFAHPDVKFAMPPAKLGIVYPARGLARFSALCGEARAREMFFTARTVTALEATRWGLVNHLVPAEDVMPRALSLAETISEMAPMAVQGMRHAFEALVRRRATLTPNDEAEIDRVRFLAWHSEDHVEGRRAFAEKRKPYFKGD